MGIKARPIRSRLMLALLCVIALVLLLTCSRLLVELRDRFQDQIDRESRIHAAADFTSISTNGATPEFPQESQHSTWNRISVFAGATACLGLVFGVILAWLIARRTTAPLSMSFGSHERFVTDVAHELKTPLTLLLSEAQVLAQSQRTHQEYERFLTTVEDEVRAMGQVVESLLMLARAEGGLQVSMGDAPVNEFVMSAVERTARMAERNEVTIVPTLAMPEAGHDSLVVHGDQALLTIAVTNLLRNAIRYAPPRTQVSIAVEAIDQHAVIHVRDGGPGIPPEHLPHIFDRFYRVPDDHSTFQGTGLGLAIAKGVVDLHRGQIHAVNLPEGGCQFTLTLGTAHT
ncbi:MAG TPA: HAMP domain-containing sensor histidine kinase [Phycisphaerae bacterium]|nr:HAMP domain-containing sensor histidine kinase [Phycisphaerae bacterium]